MRVVAPGAPPLTGRNPFMERGVTMSNWGVWGYWGIVTGLLVLLGIFFACMEILYSNAKRPLIGNTGSPAGREERAPTGSKHAA